MNHAASDPAIRNACVGPTAWTIDVGQPADRVVAIPSGEAAPVRLADDPTIIIDGTRYRGFYGGAFCDCFNLRFATLIAGVFFVELNNPSDEL